MVLYKRKQVTFTRAPKIPADLRTEVFFIEATKEWFLGYEEYLQRMDYYKRRKFVCEITGNSCLTFFEALESETREIQEVEMNFPEALREHILRFLQFNRITRLDQLVDKVYLVFKNDYFPGETIILKGSILGGSSESGARQRGTIKEKIQYSNPSDGLLTKYLVVRANDLRQAIVTNDKISRDRNHFTKWLIKAFIKLTMTRSHKVGAPWVVKNKFAKKYRIGQEYPDDLKHFESSTPSGDIIYEGEDIGALSWGEGTVGSDRKGNKKTGTTANKSLKKKAALNNILDEPPPVISQEEDLRRRLPLHHIPEHELDFEEEPYKSSPQPSNPPPKRKTVTDLRLKFNLQHSKPLPENLAMPENAKYWNSHLIQELESNQTDHDDSASDVANKARRLGVPNLRSIQQALESWVFLNVYHSVLKLDTFTFDDFVYAMGWNHDQFNNIGRCKLLDEIWCAVLGAIISNELPKNKTSRASNDEIPGLLINLPSRNSYIGSSVKSSDSAEFVDGGSESDSEVKYLKSEDEGDNEVSNGSFELNNGLNHPLVGAGEALKNYDENDGDDEGAEDEDDDNDDNDDNENGSEGDSGNEGDEDEDREHNAYIVMNYRNIPWHERLRKRNFKDGNWQCILLGVLSLVDDIPAFASIIDKIYRILAPIDLPATTTTVMNQFYDTMDIDFKFEALSIIVSLLMNGTVVRKYIDECLDLSTVLRRNRLDNIRDFKVAFELAQKLNIEIHERLTAYEEADIKASKSKSKGKLKQKGSAQTPDSVKRRIPRINLQAFEMTDQEANLAEKDKEFKALCSQRRDTLTDIDEYKRSRRELEKRLNEIDCQRLKLLGKDRLYNRYWWFENNGLPTLHGSSNGDEDNEDEENGANINNEEADDSDDNAVLDETYLMGKLWVQGPSNADLRIHFKVSEEDTKKYQEIQETYGDEINEFYKHKQSVDKDDKLKDSQQYNLINYDDFPKGFRDMCSEFFGLKLDSNRISRLQVDSKQDEVVIDQYGGLTMLSLANELTPLQRKILEESPDPLMNGFCWRFYDKPKQITKLIDWLNPWGERESQLRKELLSIKDAIVSSMTARRKALFLDARCAAELEVENKIIQVKNKLKLLEENEKTNHKVKEELNNEEDKNDSENRNKDIDESDEDTVVGTKRASRKNYSSNKRQKKPFSESIEECDPKELIDLHSSLLEKLQEEREEKELSRVLEWVNSKAIEECDKSLYEGGDKYKPRNNKSKR